MVQCKNVTKISREYLKPLLERGTSGSEASVKKAKTNLLPELQKENK